MSRGYQSAFFKQAWLMELGKVYDAADTLRAVVCGNFSCISNPAYRSRTAAEGDYSWLLAVSAAHCAERSRGGRRLHHSSPTRAVDGKTEQHLRPLILIHDAPRT
jgi:hypothetical protein